MGEKSFETIHKELKELSLQKKIRYVFRHNPPKSNKRISLQGFGVEMALKSTEYKVIDERKPEEEKTNDTKQKGRS